ncbi:MAG: ABC transporter permease subunit [Bacteroidetes bacterium]|jgi:peptide/nickel transport system permease protein|nr:ABC transporter permease subunit [Bacteroidota bacterium]
MRGKPKILIITGVILLFCAVGAEFIANNTPIIYTHNGTWTCGVCKEWPGRDSHRTPKSAKIILNPPIAYDDDILSKESKYLSPPLTSESNGTHWLGTDSQSRDVLAGIIYGTRYAILIGIISAFFSLLVGIFLGSVAAYYGDTRYRLKPLYWVSILIVLLILIYLSYYAIVSGYVMAAMFGSILISLRFLGSKDSGTQIPVNQFVTKTIELFDSLPALFVLLAWAATIDYWNIWTLSLLIAFFRWPTFARLVRAEMTPWASSAWIKSLRALKMSDLWIMKNQLANLIVVPVSVHAAFAVAGAVSIEATLSFLGFGLGVETQSWGRLLSDARLYSRAWWLVIFPGAALFVFLWWSNQIARYIQKNNTKPSL